jgi:transposase-like protein
MLAPFGKAIMLGLTPTPIVAILALMKKTKILCTKPNMSLHQLKAKFSNEEACKSYLKALRWPKDVTCPRCGNEKVYTLKARPFHWLCKAKDCGGKNGYRFSVISGTVFENTNYPLSTWFEVIYLMTQSKKGMSALQIHRQIGSGDYRTAWYMCHRIRAAMNDKDITGMLGGHGGEVEVDETFMGGKEHNKHFAKRIKGRGTSGKTPVIGAIARKGNVVCQMIENTDTATLDGFVRKTVADDVSLVATDEHAGYRLLDKDFNHKAVKHGAGEYVRGNIHTSNIDSFWSLLKRGVMGTYHHMSKEYLPLYLSEFSFRHNNRNNPNIFRAVVAGC